MPPQLFSSELIRRITPCTNTFGGSRELGSGSRKALLMPTYKLSSHRHVSQTTTLRATLQ